MVTKLIKNLQDKFVNCIRLIAIGTFSVMYLSHMYAFAEEGDEGLRPPQQVPVCFRVFTVEHHGAEVECHFALLL